MKNIKTFTGFLSLLIALSFAAFCSTAQAQYDNPDEQLYIDENPYETEDTIPEEYIEQYPDDAPTLDEDDFQPDIIDPAYEDPDNELLRDLEDDMELPPPADEFPGDKGQDSPLIDDTLPPPGSDNPPLEDPGFDLPPDMMLEDSESNNSTEDNPVIDLPSPEITDMASGMPSGLSTELSSPQTPPAQCAQAAGHVIILLEDKGIHSGVTYLQPEARVDFQNQSNVTHHVTIWPQGFFTSNNFTITGQSIVARVASSPAQVTVGRIDVSTGNNQTKHFMVICP
ncbi:MAG: hypothetical protein U9R66_02965 [Thermodesulfobacteriota bacterium]|nr:hypothetical protein [Thermodesulfobacteriota bacterium]